MRPGPALALILAAAPATAEEAPRRFDCQTATGEAVALSLWQPSPFGALHCVEGPDLSPAPSCAPQGGWGLGDGAGGLASVTGEASVAAGDVPAFFARVGPSEFVASAATGPGVPLTLEIGGGTFWRLRVALATGQGIVATADGEVALRCRERS